MYQCPPDQTSGLQAETRRYRVQMMVVIESYPGQRLHIDYFVVINRAYSTLNLDFNDRAVVCQRNSSATQIGSILDIGA
jgi:hypothetical protein